MILIQDETAAFYSIIYTVQWKVKNDSLKSEFDSAFDFLCKHETVLSRKTRSQRTKFPLKQRLSAREAQRSLAAQEDDLQYRQDQLDTGCLTQALRSLSGYHYIF